MYLMLAIDRIIIGAILPCRCRQTIVRCHDRGRKPDNYQLPDPELHWLPDPGIRNRLKNATLFVDEHGFMSQCATRAILPLISVSDPEIKEVALSHIKNALNEKMGGRHYLISFFFGVCTGT
jgi:hypothetical protein